MVQSSLTRREAFPTSYPALKRRAKFKCRLRGRGDEWSRECQKNLVSRVINDEQQISMGTLFVISIALLAVANGALLTLLVIEKIHASTRIAIGSVLGIAALSWVAFLTAAPLGLNATSISVTVAIFGAGLAVQVRFIGRGRIVAALREFGMSLAAASITSRGRRCSYGCSHAS